MATNGKTPKRLMAPKVRHSLLAGVLLYHAYIK